MRVFIILISITLNYAIDVIWDEEVHISKSQTAKAYSKYRKYIKNIDPNSNLTIWQNSQTINHLDYEYAKNRYYKRVYPDRYKEKYSNYIVTINNLMWQKEPYTKQEIEAKTNSTNYKKALNLYYSFKYCNNLDLMFYTDWRLPKLGELIKLYNSKQLLDDSISDIFWSSSYDQRYIDHGFGLDFDSGEIAPDYKKKIHFVRCVREIR